MAWGKDDPASLRLATDALTKSIDHQLIARFSDFNSRHAAVNALPESVRKGAIQWIEGWGWYGHDGDTTGERDGTVRFMTGDLETQSGTYGNTTQPTGLMLVPFTYPFDTGYIPKVSVSHATTDSAAPPLDVMVYIKPGFTTPTNFHVLVKNVNNTVAGGVYVDISWIAHGPKKRPASS